MRGKPGVAILVAVDFQQFAHLLKSVDQSGLLRQRLGGSLDGDVEQVGSVQEGRGGRNGL